MNGNLKINSSCDFGVKAKLSLKRKSNKQRKEKANNSI
jgi:hypothetical protein